jgi:hypothetical protein
MQISPKLQASITGVTSGIIEMQKQLEAAQQAAIKGELNDTVTLLLNELNLPGLFIYGYTPGFNDGEPCEHCMEIGDAYHDQSDDTWESEGTYGANFDSRNDSNLADEACIQLRKSRFGWQAAEALFGPLENAIASAFGTNWFLLWKKNDDGSVELIRGHYDVGH